MVEIDALAAVDDHQTDRENKRHAQCWTELTRPVTPAVLIEYQDKLRHVRLQ